jgi:transposase
LLGKLAQKDETIRVKQLKIDQLTHEMAILKRWRFGRRSEQLESGQRSLLEESIDEDLEAISVELEALQEPAADRPPKQKPRREPEQTACSCGCALERIGEDVSEKLGYIPPGCSARKGPDGGPDVDGLASYLVCHEAQHQLEPIRNAVVAVVP